MYFNALRTYMPWFDLKQLIFHKFLSCTYTAIKVLTNGPGKKFQNTFWRLSATKDVFYKV